MALIFNILKFLAIITFFLPALFIPKTNVAIFYIFSIILFVATVLFKKNFINDLFVLYKNTPFKYLLYFAVWVIISGFILVIFGIYPVKAYLFYLFWTVGVVFILTYLFPYSVCEKNIIKLIKIILIANLITYIFGLIQYFGDIYSIGILQNFVNIFSNARDNVLIYLEANEFRLKGFLEEPAWFGFFVFINLPLLLNVFTTKYKIFKNKYLNITIKKVLLPLALLCLFLTKSPIWIIFNLLFLGWYLIRNIDKRILLIVTIISIFIVLTVIQIGNSDNSALSENFIYRRVYIFLNSFSSFELLVEKEPSLGNRLISYVASYRIFSNHPIFGVGLGYTKYHIMDIFLHTDIPLTRETIMNIINAGEKGVGFNGAFLWNLLSETGIIGTALFYIFVFRSIMQLKKMQNYLHGLVGIFNNSVLNSLVIFIFVSWYDINYARLLVWFYFGITAVIYMFVRSLKYIRKPENNDIH